MASRIHFWDLLDAAPDACMPLSAWTERLGDDICVLRRFLIRNGTLATHIADHSSQAVRRAIRSDGEKWWREKATGEGLELTDVDSLVNWRVDWPNLTEEVRVALDLHKVANMRGTNFRATRIGRLDASEDSSTLVLSLATTPREQFTSLMECASDPGVVAFFTVSGAEWRDDFVRRVKEQDIALACLSSTTRCGMRRCSNASVPSHLFAASDSAITTGGNCSKSPTITSARSHVDAAAHNAGMLAIDASSSSTVSKRRLWIASRR